MREDYNCVLVDLIPSEAKIGSNRNSAGFLRAVEGKDLVGFGPLKTHCKCCPRVWFL